MQLTLPELQAYTIDMTRETVRILEENQITYFCNAGTVLGAIRHQGPIPWDYDVDLSIPQNEMDRACRILQEKLPSRFYLDCYQINRRYNRLFPRIGLTGYTTDVLHLDLFRLVGVPEDRKQQEKFNKNAVYLKELYHYRVGRMPSKSPIKKAMKQFLHIVCMPLPRRSITQAYEQLCEKYPYETAKYIKNPNGRYGMKNIMDKDIYQAGILVPYLDFMVRVPSNYEAYLNKLYRDYHKLPPIAERQEAMEAIYEIEEVRP